MLSRILVFVLKHLGNPGGQTLPKPKTKRLSYEKRRKMRRKNGKEKTKKAQEEKNGQ